MKEYTRPYNEKEKRILKGFKHSYWDHFEHFAKKWMIITIISLIPLLFFQKINGKVSSENQLLILIPLQIITIIIVIYLMKKMGEIGWNKKVNFEIENGKAEVKKIKTEKVIKRKETYDLGSGFYIQIAENKTLYLQGQYYDELEYEKEFPNTEFEISKTSLIIGTTLDINLLGKYLKPEKELDAFTKEQFEKQQVHYDEDIINISINEIE